MYEWIATLSGVWLTSTEELSGSVSGWLQSVVYVNQTPLSVDRLDYSVVFG